MRRYGFLILFVVVLALPFVLRLAMGRPAQRVGEGHGAELVIITANQEGLRREFAEAFDAWHREKFGQGVSIDYRVFGASDIQKYFQAGKDTIYKTHGTYKIDVVWGGGDYLFEQFKKAGYLQPLRLDAGVMKAAFPRPDLGGVALHDLADPPSWFGMTLSSFGIVFNRDACRYLGMEPPATWADLKDPRYAGWVAVADPTRSSSAKQAFMVIVERAMADAAEQGRSEDEGWARGMGLVRQIAANARLFAESSPVVPSLVSTGDAAAGMSIDFYSRAQADAVGEARMGYIEPLGATAMNPDPIGMVRGAQHPELAKRFIEFVLSEQGQRLLILRPGTPGGPRQTALRRVPIRPSVFADMSNFTDKFNPYAAARGFNKSNAREKTWDIVADLIEMSCMDLLDELRQTRREILASPRAAELDARLGVFPFDQQEALRRAGQWKKASPAERLEMKRQWTEQFREEYRRLRQEARAGRP